MELKQLIVDSKAAWVDFPGLDGFEIEVVNLARKELLALREKTTKNIYNRKTKAMEEEMDEEMFVSEFTNSTIKGWRGLKLKFLEEILLVDLKDADPESMLPYTQENAELLVSSSAEFDNWLNEVVFDLDNFRTATKGRTRKQTEAVA